MVDWRDWPTSGIVLARSLEAERVLSQRAASADVARPAHAKPHLERLDSASAAAAVTAAAAAAIAAGSARARARAPSDDDDDDVMLSQIRRGASDETAARRGAPSGGGGLDAPPQQWWPARVIAVSEYCDIYSSYQPCHRPRADQVSRRSRGRLRRRRRG